MAVSVQEYRKALLAFEEALTAMNKSNTSDVERKLFRDAGIQRFEFCVELAWKVSKKVMETRSSAPKEVVREMAQAGLIENPENWFGYLEARNLSSHSYDEKIAEKIQSLFLNFQQDANLLLKQFLK